MIDPVRSEPGMRRSGRPAPPALLSDVVLVAVFVLLGRTSHQEGGAVAGYLTAAWPFLTGALVGWAVIGLVRRAGRDLPGDSIPAGALVLGSTVVLGMVLRRAFTDGGTPVSFLVVATSFLAVFLLGWRGVERVRRRRASRA